MSILTPILNAISPQRKARLTRDQILAQYGPPGPTYQEKYCRLVNISAVYPWFPYKGNVLINNEFWAKLYGAFYELSTTDWVIAVSGIQEQKVGFLSAQIKTFDGCYNDRNTRGTSMISLHAWAMAIDLNASSNQLGQKTPAWTPEFLNVMRKYVYCGADFISRKDPMHFSLYGE